MVFKPGDLCVYNYLHNWLHDTTNLHDVMGAHGHRKIKFSELYNQLVEVVQVEAPHSGHLEVYFFAHNGFFYVSPRELTLVA